MTLVRISTSVDPNTQNVLFTLQFSHVPNFYVVDASNRQQARFKFISLMHLGETTKAWRADM